MEEGEKEKKKWEIREGGNGGAWGRRRRLNYICMGNKKGSIAGLS